ncbi:MAG: hypothetical protein ACQEWF_12240 [Bacillota bacterium]
MKNIKILTIFTLLLASCYLSFNNNEVSAQIQLSNQEKFLQGAFEFEENFETLEGKEALKYYKKALKSVKKQNVSLKADINKNNKVTVFFSKDDNLGVVNIDVTNEDEALHSIGIIINDNNISEVSEMIVTEKDSQTGNLKLYKNGKLEINQDVPKEDELSEQSAANSDTNFYTARRSLGQIWNEFTDCMKDNGVAGWVINTIITVCSIGCIASAGTACFACVIANSAFFGGKTGYCFGETYHDGR